MRRVIISHPPESFEHDMGIGIGNRMHLTCMICTRLKREMGEGKKRPGPAIGDFGLSAGSGHGDGSSHVVTGYIPRFGWANC